MLHTLAIPRLFNILRLLSLGIGACCASLLRRDLAAGLSVVVADDVFAVVADTVDDAAVDDDAVPVVADMAERSDTFSTKSFPAESVSSSPGLAAAVAFADRD